MANVKTSNASQTKPLPSRTNQNSRTRIKHSARQGNQSAENENTEEAANSTSQSQLATTSTNNVNSMNAGTSPAMMGSMGMGYGSPYGMGMGGMGMGMSPMGMGMGMGMGGGPISSLNQFLFGFQTLIFSLGQAFQIVGMNTQAMHQLYDQAMGMLDQALVMLHELRTLENREIQALSEEDQKRRRRLKAIRWSLMLGISYAGYSFVAKWMKKRRDYNRRRMLGGGMPSPSNRGQNYRGYAGAGAGEYPYGSNANAGYSSYQYGGNGSSYPYGNNMHGGYQSNYPSTSGYGYSGQGGYSNSGYY